MKTIPIALAAHYATGSTTLCICLQVTRADGLVLGFTTLDREITVGAVTYIPGFDVSSIASTATLGVDNLELTILPDDDIPEQDLLTGLWNNAWFYIFECNYESPADGVNGLKRGTTGEVQIRGTAYTLEFRGLTQFLQQTVGIATQRTCRARLADYPTPVLGSLCRLDPADWTVTGTITGVTSRQVFTDSARAEADEWFKEGVLKFTSGANTGRPQKVKLFAAGVFTLSLPMPYAIEIGDTYMVIAGCQKRHERTLDNLGGVSDCIDKFNNIPNFQGEPHLPGVDAITKPPGSVEQP